jgi:hypothetical protein
MRSFSSVIGTSARTHGPQKTLRQGLVRSPGEHKSSPRPGSRDGMKQEPYELRFIRIAVKG